MIEFEYIEKSRISEYKRYYDYTDALGCEFNFVSAFLWRGEYRLKIGFYRDTLIKAYFRDDGSVWGYCMPSGKNVREAVELLISESEKSAAPLSIAYLSRRERDLLEELFPGAFEITEVGETRDYIYLTEDLAQLRGKRYQAKRNHISRFNRSFDDWRTEPIGDGNKGDALRVAELWCGENGYDTGEYAEYKIIRDALIYMEELGMRGMVLYVGASPVAMTLGNEISRLCFDVGFEKALRGYEGSYSVICNEFAKSLSSYKYLNREEDMGIEGLRKSKLSYHPEIIYERFHARLKT